MPIVIEDCNIGEIKGDKFVHYVGRDRVNYSKIQLITFQTALYERMRNHFMPRCSFGYA